MNTAIRLAWRKAGTLLFLIFIIISSCQKEESVNGLNPVGIRQGSLLGESKTYFQREVLAQAPMGNDGNLRHQVSKTPLWDQAEQVQLSIGPALKVPLSYDPVISIQIGPDKQAVPLSQLSYLLIYKDSQQVQYAEVVTKIPDHLHQASFSGIILVEDWWGRPIKTIQKTADRHYLQLNRPVLAPGPKGEGPANNAPAMDDCRVVVTEDEFHMYNVEYICPDRRGGGGGGGHDFPDDDSDFPRGGGQSPGPGDYDGEPRRPHGGGGGGGHHQEEPPRRQGNIIRNQVQNPCLRRLVNQVMRTDIDDVISRIISNLDEDVFVQINVIDAPETTHHEAAEYAMVRLPNSNVINGTITLSTNVFSNSTQEYVLTSFTHEVVHAYLEYSGKSTMVRELDHQTIASEYINPIVRYLTTAFRMSARDATALAWIGVNDSLAFKDTDIFYYENGNFSKTEITNIYANYVSGLLGKPICHIEEE